MFIIVGTKDAVGRNNVLTDMCIGRLEIYPVVVYFFDNKGMVYTNHIPSGKTVNTDYITKALHTEVYEGEDA
jgi:hypothetical protein